MIILCILYLYAFELIVLLILKQYFWSCHCIIWIYVNFSFTILKNSNTIFKFAYALKSLGSALILIYYVRLYLCLNRTVTKWACIRDTVGKQGEEVGWEHHKIWYLHSSATELMNCAHHILHLANPFCNNRKNWNAAQKKNNGLS